MNSAKLKDTALDKNMKRSHIPKFVIFGTKNKFQILMIFITLSPISHFYLKIILNMFGNLKVNLLYKMNLSVKYAMLFRNGLIIFNYIIRIIIRLY